MPVQFFGQYLLEKKIVNREQLLLAIAFQESQNLKLGEYAVQRGFIGIADAERINQLQQSRDLRFGDAAIELGLLAPAQVNELVTIQRNNHVYLGDAIVRRGFTSQEVIYEALRTFKEEQEHYRGVARDLTGYGLPERGAYEACIDLTPKLLLRMWGVQCKVGEPKIVTGNVTLGGHVVLVSFAGQFRSRVFFSAPTESVSKGAEQTLKETNADDETRDDLLREFANVVCGNVVALLARDGRTCEIQPPVSIHGDVALGPEKGLQVPLVMADGQSGAILLTFP